MKGGDGQEFTLGDARIRLIHTPGHTLESTCYLLMDNTGKPTALFTGDTLFIGDVGRPDLAQHVVTDLTPEKLAGMLFDSLRNKIMPLPDDIILYPAHGAGSACGKKMSSETQDTLGNQKKTNYALDPKLTREGFIRELLTGLTPPPGYFPKNVLMNIQGYDSFDEVIKRGYEPLSADNFERIKQESDVWIIDTRMAEIFSDGFIPGSINIGIDGGFAVWVGTLVPDIDQKILVVAEPGREKEVITRLSRVGYDHCLGYLEGGIDAWKKSGKILDHIKRVSAEGLSEIQKDIQQTHIIDVRKNSEYEAEHIAHALNLPLDSYKESMASIDKAHPYYVHCAAGYRSMIYISLLRANGFHNLIDVTGGYKAIKASGKFILTADNNPQPMLK
jgi:rhodanese-related sulfurtransferase